MISFSIIIPTRTISDYLKETIAYLQEMEYKSFEVIVVTDQIENFGYITDSRFIFLNSGGSGNPCFKRNLGAKAASGEVLVFLDDDAFPRSDWLYRAAEIFTQSNNYALGGPAVTPLNAGFLEKASGYVLQSYLASGGTTYRHMPKKAKEINDYPTVNLFVKKRAFEKVGGFILDFWPGEDTKLCFDLIHAYKRNFIYDPKPIVYHHRRNLFSPHLKQVSRYGAHRGQFARIYPENSRVLSYFIPSIFVLWLVIGNVVVVLWKQFLPAHLIVMAIYGSLLLLEGANVYQQEKGLKMAVYVIVGIFLTHIVYGINFIIGLIKRPKLKLRAVDQVTGNYLGG